MRSIGALKLARCLHCTLRIAANGGSELVIKTIIYLILHAKGYGCVKCKMVNTAIVNYGKGR